MDEARAKKHKFYVKIPKDKPDTAFESVKKILKDHKGYVPTYIYTEKDEKMMMAPSDYWVNIESEGLYGDIDKLLGENCTVVK